MSSSKQYRSEATIIMTFHNEGILAHKSLLGFQRMRDYMQSKNKGLDLICVLDSPAESTKNIIQNFISKFGNENDQIVEVAFKSLAASRNSGIDLVKTDYVGFLDGDDFLSKNWVYEALKHQKKIRNRVLCFPKYVISFGKHNATQIIKPSSGIPIPQLINTHYWNSASFGHISIYRDLFYNEIINRNNKFVFEDWDFNLRCIAQKIEIEPVNNTYLFYRRKHNSMLLEHVALQSLTPPSAFFDTIHH